MKTTYFSILFFAFSFVLKAQNLQFSRYSAVGSEMITSLHADASGNVWVGTEKGIFKINKTEAQCFYAVAKPSNESEASRNQIADVAPSGDGKFVVGTFGNHLTQFNTSGSFSEFITLATEGYHLVSGIAVSDNGTVWVSMLQKALFAQFEGGRLQQFTVKNSKINSDNVYCVAPKGNGVWVGSDKGLQSFNGKSWEKHTPQGQITALLANKNQAWAAAITNDGTVLWKKEANWTTLALPLELRNARITAIYADDKGKIWLAAHVIACWDNKEWKTYGNENGFESKAATAIVVDGDNIVWVGTEGKGLFRGEIIEKPKDKDKKLDNKLVENKSIENPTIEEKKDIFSKETVVDADFEKPIELKIAFAQSQAELLPASMQELDRVANWLLQHETLRAEIAGHTDNRGEPIANMKLSEERAKTVKKYLTNKGVKNSRLEAKGYGGTQSIADNRDEKQRHLNRRVEIILHKNPTFQK